MAAIPDFNAGAMENWGLITYRETRLLIEDGMSSASDKENAAITVAHELAHMVSSHTIHRSSHDTTFCTVAL